MLGSETGVEAARRNGLAAAESACKAQAVETSPEPRVRMYLVYLKYWTLNLMPRKVYPNVLIHPNFSIKGDQSHNTPKDADPYSAKGQSCR